MSGIVYTIQSLKWKKDDKVKIKSTNRLKHWISLPNLDGTSVGIIKYHMNDPG